MNLSQNRWALGRAFSKWDKTAFLYVHLAASGVEYSRSRLENEPKEKKLEYQTAWLTNRSIIHLNTRIAIYVRGAVKLYANKISETI